MISKTQIITNIIHEDSWTETIEGIHYFLKLIDSQDDSVPKEPLNRVVIILSHYLVEVMFWDTVKNFVKEMNVDLLEKVLSKLEGQTGFSRAIEEWPKMLTGKSFNLGDEPFQSLNSLIKYRNEIIHTNFLDQYASASSAYYSAVRISEEIEKHFFPTKAFHYKDWVKIFPPPIAKTFQQSFNEIKKK